MSKTYIYIRRSEEWAWEEFRRIANQLGDSRSRLLTTLIKAYLEHPSVKEALESSLKNIELGAKRIEALKAADYIENNIRIQKLAAMCSAFHEVNWGRFKATLPTNTPKEEIDAFEKLFLDAKEKAEIIINYGKSIELKKGIAFKTEEFE